MKQKHTQKNVVYWWVDFSVWYKIRVQLHSFALGYPVFPMPFVKETILPLLCILGTLVKNQFARYVRVYFWSLFCSITLHVCLYADVILFYSLQLCDIFWNQEVWCLQLSSFSGLFWLSGVLCGSILIFIYLNWTIVDL